MDTDGEISIYAEDGDIDYDDLAFVDRWSIYLAV
jgi:hypothetical protein